MNIKKILLLILIMSGYSFSVLASADYIKYQATGSYTGCIEYPFGNGLSQFKSNIVKEYGCISEHFRPVSVSSLTMINDYMGDITLCGTAEWGQTVCMSHGVHGSDAFCPEGFTFNEPTGECLLEPDEPYCRSDEFLTQKEAAEKSCFESGSQDFSYTCDDETSTHSFFCAAPPPPPGECTIDSPDYPACLEPDPDPEPCEPGAIDYPACLDDDECVPSQDNNWCDNPPCKIGYAGYPECLGWYDEQPIDPIEPFDPPTLPPVDTKPPADVKPVNPAPTPQPGDPFDDSRIIQSIQNLNQDMNIGFSDINGALQLQTNVLSDTNSLIYGGLQQDLLIYENNLKNSQNNTNKLIGTIGDSSSDIIDSISGIEFVDNDDTDEAVIVSAIDKLANKIPEQCIPTDENNQCENSHGLDDAYLTEMFTQLNEKMDIELSSADSTLISAANEFVTTPVVDEQLVSPFLDLEIAFLTGNDNCVALDWYGYELSCEFSDRFKQIFGFLLYMWTLKTLGDILLTGITPHSANYMRRKG